MRRRRGWPCLSMTSIGSKLSRRCSSRRRHLGADADEDSRSPQSSVSRHAKQVSDLRAYIIKLQEALDGLKSARERRAGEAAAVQ